MNAYTYLAIAICAEVIATASMKAVKGLSTPLPLLLMVVGYGIAFWMLTLVVRSIPVGIAYAIWSGLGIVLISVAALVIYGQKLDIAGDAWHGHDRGWRGGDSAVLEDRWALRALVRGSPTIGPSQV